MSFQLNISNLATRIALEFKTVRTMLSGTSTGDVSGLSTTATNLVAAINELKTGLDGVSASALTTAQVTTIAQNEAQTKIDALIDSAPGTLDTLNELATALGNDPNFATTITTQLAAKADSVTVNAALAAKANAADVYTKTEVGDPTTNYVAIFEAELAA